ncbi:MAG: hypothetical protein SCH71_08955 [Desulfobulbaceae bacterium]|nr:hypothetical protein [Desulfobulbaceae bacterium]
MQSGHDDKIKEIIGQINCPKGYRCVAAGLVRLCRAMDVGKKTYLECLEKDIKDCPFSVRFAGAIYCKCPLRIYLEKNLRR